MEIGHAQGEGDEKTGQRPECGGCKSRTLRSHQKLKGARDTFDSRACRGSEIQLTLRFWASDIDRRPLAYRTVKEEARVMFVAICYSSHRK